MTNTYFRIAAADKRITDVDMAAFHLLKAATSVQEDKLALARILLPRAFSPIKLPSKLNSGARPYQALNGAVMGVRATLRAYPTAFGMTPEQGEVVLALASEIGRF